MGLGECGHADVDLRRQWKRNEHLAIQPRKSAGDIVVVRVMYLWPVFIGPLGFNLANHSNGSRLIMASAAFQNEPANPRVISP